MHLHLWHAVFLSSYLALSAPLLLLLLFYSLTHENCILQCRPRSLALWSAPRQDPVTPSMTSWSSLRSVSLKPTESKPALFSLLFWYLKGYVSHFIVFSCYYFSKYSVHFIEHSSLSSYIPAVVDHRGGMPCHGTFLLHQVRPCTILYFGLKDEEMCFP